MFIKSIRTYFGFSLCLLTLFLSQPLESPLLAQTNTPVPNRLTFNQTVSGQLRGKGDTLTYTVDVPQDQDVIFAYRTTKYVSAKTCFFVDGGGGCAQKGGGGGDGPLSLVEYVATHGKEGQQATLTLERQLDESANFQLTAYAVTPQTIEMGTSTTVEHTGRDRFQVFTLESDTQTPFTVTTEDKATNGNYLWAAYQPFASADLSPTETPLIHPVYIDGASVGNHPTFTSRLYVYYGGGNTFRVLVEADESYILNANTAILPMLEENQTINMSISYRQPIWVAQLNTQTGDTIKVNFTVKSGTGAIGRVYQGMNQVNQGLLLGTKSANGSTFPLTGSIETVVDTEVYAVVQIPFDFTRETVNVEVAWERIN